MIPFPDKKYRIIYADPPWSYKNKRTGGSMKSGASSKYPTMSVDDICDLPVKDIAHENSVLFLWATVPLLPEERHGALRYLGADGGHRCQLLG